MADADVAARVRAVVTEQGPQTGAQLQQALGDDLFPLWKACTTAPDLELRVVGRRYVRLDRTVEGFARLSPSILREFLTYTVVGSASEPDRLDEAARLLTARITVISRSKRRLAERIVQEAFGPLVRQDRVDPDLFAVLIAGDIVYSMAHDVARRESSTSALVAGSDLDLIVLVDDSATELMPTLDQALLSRKWLYLRNPAFREEVDYIVKPMAKLDEQARFDTFPSMVACKVFDEAQVIYGNPELHTRGLALLEDAGAITRLRELHEAATANREVRRDYLLSLPGDTIPSASAVSFYAADEAAEFEHF